MNNNNILISEIKGITTRIPNKKEQELITKEEQKKNIKICTGYLENKTMKCPCCGIITEDTSQIVKNGTRISKIKLGKSFDNKLYILWLKKQRYKCKHCNSSFSATHELIDKHCFISNYIKESIKNLLVETMSRKTIAKLINVSDTTVLRIQTDIAKSIRITPIDTLPKHLCFDEIKTTKNVLSSMSFIFSDAVTHEVIDIVDNRKLYSLKQYFIRYDYKVRKQVETICIDMYPPYMDLIREMFPNAKIIIDRFHIVQALNRELNNFRVKVMNGNLNFDKPLYNKLKYYWKLLLTHRDKLEYYRYKKHRLFKSMITTKEIVDYIIATNDILSSTYLVVHMLRDSLKNRDYTLFFETLYNANSTDISEGLNRVLRTFRKYEEYITNSCIYEYSNGSLEGINNKIKTFKRVSYGYRNFYHLRDRLLIAFASNNKLKSS